MGKGFIAIAAMSENRVIGAQGKIPWHIPDEFKWFKQATMGHVLVMGRKTYESIGRPLPGRRTIVLSRQLLEIPGVTVVDSLEKIDPAASEGEVFIAGGAEVYRQALPLVTEIYLKVVMKQVEGDVLFPVFEEQFEQVEVLREHSEFTVYRYRRIKATAGKEWISFRRFSGDMGVQILLPIAIAIIALIAGLLLPILQKIFALHRHG